MKKTNIMICELCSVESFCNRKKSGCDVTERFNELIELQNESRSLIIKYKKSEENNNKCLEEVLSKLNKYKELNAILNNKYLINECKEIIDDEVLIIKDSAKKTCIKENFKQEQQDLFFIEKSLKYYKEKFESSLISFIVKVEQCKEKIVETETKVLEKKAEPLEKKAELKESFENIAIKENIQNHVESIIEEKQDKILCLTCAYIFTKTYEQDKKIVCILDVERSIIKKMERCSLYSKEGK